MFELSGKMSHLIKHIFFLFPSFLKKQKNKKKQNKTQNKTQNRGIRSTRARKKKNEKNSLTRSQ